MKKKKHKRIWVNVNLILQGFKQKNQRKLDHHLCWFLFSSLQHNGKSNSTLGGEFLPAHSSKLSSILTGTSQGRDVRQLICWVHNEKERGKCWSSTYFLFLLTPGPHAIGMVTETFKVTLPRSVNPFWKHLHRHSQRCLPSTTMKIGHHLIPVVMYRMSLPRNYLTT